MDHKQTDRADNVQVMETALPTVAEVEAMISRAVHSGNAEAGDIASMCAITGKTRLISGFLSAKKSAAEVGEYLMKAQVEAEAGTQLITSVMPGVDAKSADDKSQGTARPWKQVLKRLGLTK